MKILPTDVYGESLYLWKAGKSFCVESPLDGAILSRDNVEQLIAELESLLRED